MYIEGVREWQGEFTYKRVMTNKQTVSGSKEIKEMSKRLFISA